MANNDLMVGLEIGTSKICVVVGKPGPMEQPRFSEWARRRHAGCAKARSSISKRP